MSGAMIELLDAEEGLSDVGVEASGHVFAVHVLKGFASQDLVRGIQLSEDLLDGFAVDWDLVRDVKEGGFCRSVLGGLFMRGHIGSGGVGGGCF